MQYLCHYRFYVHESVVQRKSKCGVHSEGKNSYRTLLGFVESGVNPFFSFFNKLLFRCLFRFEQSIGSYYYIIESALLGKLYMGNRCPRARCRIYGGGGQDQVLSISQLYKDSVTGKCD